MTHLASGEDRAEVYGSRGPDEDCTGEGASLCFKRRHHPRGFQVEFGDELLGTEACGGA